MIIVTPDSENLLDELINNRIIQFGGNASIGYGLIKVEQIAGSKTE
jgi:CRISPR/Cas system CMR subunit Cmr4 (Cas7 group RAMP superfamily)